MERKIGKLEAKKIETDIIEGVEGVINSFLIEQEKFKSKKEKLENFKRSKRMFELKTLVKMPGAKKITYNDFSAITYEDYLKYGVEYICQSIFYSYFEQLISCIDDIESIKSKNIKGNFLSSPKVPVQRKDTIKKYEKIHKTYLRISKKSPKRSIFSIVKQIAKRYETSEATVLRAINAAR